MRHKIALLTLAVVAATSLHAQEEGGYNESVVVRGSYTPTIEQSEKLYFPAVITDSLGKMEHDFQYSISPSRLKSVYEPTRIKAARIVGEPATKLYNNYLRLGFGNYWTPLADLYWSSTRDREKTYGIRVNHLSSWGSIPDYGPVHENNTSATAFGKYIVANKLQLAADLGYEHDHNLFYGFTDSLLTDRYPALTRDDISTSEYRASYNLAQANLSLRNMELDPNKLGYSARVHVEDLWATYSRNQFGLTVGGDIHYGFEIARRYRGIAFLEADWQHYADQRYDNQDLIIGYLSNVILPSTNDPVNNQRDIIRVSPYADFLIGGLQMRAGLTTAFDYFSDSNDDKHFYVFPDVSVCKKLMHDNLALSLEATGGLDANTWNSMRLINPYIALDVAQKATAHYDFVGRMRWTLSRKLEANAEVSYKLLRDDLTFDLSPAYSLRNVYDAVYMSYDRLTAGGDLAFVNDEMLTVRAGGHYYHNFNISSGSYVPYRPDWDALLGVDVNYKDKWLGSIEGRLLSKMKGNTEELPMRYGIRAEIEYRHNRAISFFLRADNLAFQRYYLWQNYPSHRGLFILGLTYTIPHK